MPKQQPQKKFEEKPRKHFVNNNQSQTNNNNNNALPILDDNTFIDNITQKTKTPPQEIAIPEFLKKSIR